MIEQFVSAFTLVRMGCDAAHPLVDEEVLRLEISVQNPVLVAEGRTLEELEHEAAHRDGVKSALFAVNVHVLLQVLLHKLEYEEEARFGVDDIVKTNNVSMPKLLHERNLANCRRWGTFFCVKVDLFEGDDIVGHARSTLW